LFSTSSALAQTAFNPETSGISKTELNIILQSCIDLPELQKYYSISADGSKEQLIILQYPLSFGDINLIKNSKSVEFKQNTDIDKLSNSNYFMFRRILVDQNQFKIIFSYFYNKDSQGKKNITIILDLSKSDSVWTIINSSISGDTL
jgi:hypothetical protein